MPVLVTDAPVRVFSLAAGQYIVKPPQYCQPCTTMARPMFDRKFQVVRSFSMQSLVVDGKE